ncbi:CinA family protein [Ureaplasma parvum]|uniref:CinA family protein n=1 Tax=Ureaplasma parvum TaxID=134821 RepID=UPI0026F0BFF7|nr:CinA family protein [Ureaplasma parvum]
MNVALELINLLKERRLRLSVCESASCGALSSSIGEIAGASSVFAGGFISYSNEVKIKLVGVSEKTIFKYGAVSEQTAKEMCLQTNQKFNTDIAISITGNAGPQGSENKEVGLFYIGIAIKDFAIVKKVTLNSNERTFNRFSIAWEAISYLIELIKK